MSNHSTQENHKTAELVEEPTPGCYVKARHVLALMGFLAMFNVYTLRTNLSVAIVAMVNITKEMDDNNASSTCAGSFSNLTSKTNMQNGVFNWNTAQQGLALGCYYYGYIISNIPGAWLARRVGFKVVLGVDILGSSIITLFTPMAAYANFKLFVALRILLGFFHGVSFPTMQGAWFKWAPPYERSILISTHISGASFGTFVTMPITGWIASKFGWEAVFYFTGVCGVVWSLVWFAIIYNSPQEHPRISEQEKSYIIESIGLNKTKEVKVRTPWKAMLTSPPLLSAVVGHFASNWGNYTLLSMLPTYLTTILMFNVASSGALSSVPYILQWMVTVGGGYITDVIRRRRIMSTTAIRKINTTLGLGVPALFVVLAGYIGCNATAAIVFFSISVAFNALTVPGCKVSTVDIAPKYGGICYGISNTVANISGFLAPQVVGFLLLDGNNLNRWQLVFWISAIIYACGAVVYIFFGSGEEQPWAKGKVVLKNELLDVSDKLDQE